MGYRQSRKVGGAKHPQASDSGYCRSAREHCRVHTEANGSVMVGAWRNWVCHWLVQVPNQIGFHTTRISKRTCSDHLPVRRWSSNLAQSQRFWLPPAKLHAPSPVGERVTGRRTTEQQIFHSRFRRVTYLPISRLRAWATRLGTSTHQHRTQTQCTHCRGRHERQRY